MNLCFAKTKGFTRWQQIRRVSSRYCRLASVSAPNCIEKIVSYVIIPRGTKPTPIGEKHDSMDLEFESQKVDSWRLCRPHVVRYPTYNITIQPLSLSFHARLGYIFAYSRSRNLNSPNRAEWKNMKEEPIWRTRELPFDLEFFLFWVAQVLTNRLHPWQ